jgi:hypothetical protein
VTVEEYLAEWPNCSTPDCPNKACTWANVTTCYRCAEHELGAAEMERRYAETHDPVCGCDEDDCLCALPVDAEGVVCCRCLEGDHAPDLDPARGW